MKKRNDAAAVMLASLTLPEPPAQNRYFRIFRGRAVKSQEARDYSTLALAAFRAQTTKEQRAALPASQPVGVVLRWFRAARRGDLDGRAKVCLDALQGLLYENDSQVERLEMTRHESPRAGRLEVELWG